MSRILQYLPELTGDEQLHVAQLFQGMTDAQVAQFSSAYRIRRRDPQHVLLATLLGFFAVAGIQRLWLGDILWGVLFLFTGGFCGVGTVIDLVRHRTLADRYNAQQANETALMVRALAPAPMPPQLGH